MRPALPAKHEDEMKKYQNYRKEEKRAEPVSQRLCFFDSQRRHLCQGHIWAFTDTVSHDQPAVQKKLGHEYSSCIFIRTPDKNGGSGNKEWDSRGIGWITTLVCHHEESPQTSVGSWSERQQRG
jgi:hypothetical protein